MPIMDLRIIDIEIHLPDLRTHYETAPGDIFADRADLFQDGKVAYFAWNAFRSDHWSTLRSPVWATHHAPVHEEDVDLPRVPTDQVEWCPPCTDWHATLNNIPCADGAEPPEGGTAC